MFLFSIATEELFKNNSCYLYPDPENGFCKEWLANRYIYSTETGNDIPTPEKASLIITLIKIMQDSPNPDQMADFILNQYGKSLGIDENADKAPYKLLLVQLSQNTSESCISGLKEFICRAFTPPCLIHKQLKGKVIYQQPCSVMCEHILNNDEMCKNVQEVLRTTPVWGGTELAYDCEALRKYESSMELCYMPPYLLEKGL